MKFRNVPSGAAKTARPSAPLGRLLAAALLLAPLGACEPTVKLAAPDKPIVINLNVKIEREVRVKVEREIEDVIRENKEIF